jgi:hypothetical protein
MSWLIIPIITIIIISFLRIRCMRQIFEYTNKKAFIATSIASILSVFCITLLYYFKQYLHIQENIYIYIYSGIIILSSIIYFRKQRFWWRILQSIVWIWLALLWWTFGWYSIAALGEESFKWIYIKKYIIWLLWEIILLGIVSWIVFGRTENLIYIIQYIIKGVPKDTILPLIQQRWFIPLLVHIGSICMTLILWFQLIKKIPTPLARGIALMSGIGSHYLFNMSQFYHFWLWTGIIIVWYLIIISYSLFRSDILYIPK